MISDALIKIMICPKCQSDLKYNKEENNLQCNNCETVYRIEKNIPIIIIDENKLNE